MSGAVDRGAGLDALPEGERDRVTSFVRDLAGLPSVVAVALGGSRARGAERPDSDVDIGLYYRESQPFDVARLRALAELRNDGPKPTVTDFYDWGPWVNGGAWLRLGGLRVDVIYRELERLEDTIDACHRGELALDFRQQPPLGFHNHTYLAELHVCRPLHDPVGVLANLKRRVAQYPKELRDAIVRQYLWGVDFALYHARGYAERADIANTVACAVRCVAYLNQVLFALNEAWFISDKSALDEIGRFALRPDAYRETVERRLSHPGATREELVATVAELDDLLRAVARLDPAGFEPGFQPA